MDQREVIASDRSSGPNVRPWHRPAKKNKDAEMLQTNLPREMGLGGWYCPLAMAALTPAVAGAWVKGCPQHVQTLLSWLLFTCLISLEVFNLFKVHINVAQRENRFSAEILWIVAQPFTVAGKRGTRRCKKEIFKVNYLLVYRVSATSAWQVW